MVRNGKIKAGYSGLNFYQRRLRSVDTLLYSSMDTPQWIQSFEPQRRAFGPCARIWSSGAKLNFLATGPVDLNCKASFSTSRASRTQAGFLSRKSLPRLSDCSTIIVLQSLYQPLFQKDHYSFNPIPSQSHWSNGAWIPDSHGTNTGTHTAASWSQWPAIIVQIMV